MRGGGDFGAPGPSHLVETSCSLHLPPPPSPSFLLHFLSFLLLVPMTSSLVTETLLLFSLVIGCSHLYFTNSFKLGSKVYLALLGVHEDLLDSGQPDLGGFSI